MLLRGVYVTGQLTIDGLPRSGRNHIAEPETLPLRAALELVAAQWTRRDGVPRRVTDTIDGYRIVRIEPVRSAA